MGTSGGSSGGGDSAVTARVVNTAINTLFSAPTVVVPAPAAGHTVEILDIVLDAVPGAVGNWSLNGAFGVYYGVAPDLAHRLYHFNVDPDMLDGSALPNDQQLFLNVVPPAARWDPAVIGGLAVVLGSDTADPVRIGGLSAVAINAAGVGYAVNDTGTVDVDFYGGGGAYKVLTVGGGGAVTSLQITAAGTGYGQGGTGHSTMAGAPQAGLGTGLTVDLTTVIQPQGDMYVSCTYRIITTH